MATGRARAWQQWWDAHPSDDPVLVYARRQGFVLETDQLSHVGVTRARARTAIRRGCWTSVARGVIAPLSAITTEASRFEIDRRRHALESAGTLLRRPDHIISGRSAAVLHGLPTRGLPARVESTAPMRVGVGRRGTDHVFAAAFAAHDMVAWHGVPVSSVERTVCDLARHSRRDGLIAADAALHEGLTTMGQLEIVIDGARGWPNVRQARGIIAFADARTESPLESLTRLALHDDGFPAPEPQLLIGPYRVDFCWLPQGLVLEADGREKYTADALWEEKKRELFLHRAGYRVERVIWSDITREWLTTSRRLRVALQQRRLPT